MRFMQSLATALVGLAGTATLVGVSAPAAQAATTAVTLPITQYSQMLVDPIHQHLFITSGYGSSTILVTDYSGQTVAVIPNEQGATGLALSSDGSTIYAGLANADAVSAISTSTLTETARYSTGAAAPYYVAYSSGKVWFSYNSAIDCGIGSIDPSTSPATVTLSVGAGFWQFAPLLAASPGGVLAAAEILFSPIQLATYDVSSGTAVVLAPQQLLSGGGEARSLRITPDGQDVLLVGGGVSGVQEFQASDLSPEPTTYGGFGVNSFSLSSSGLAAVGTCCEGAGTNVVLMESSAGTTVNAYDFGPNQVANDGVALTADASELFVITLNGIFPFTPTLNIIPDPGPVGTTTTLTCRKVIPVLEKCSATVNVVTATGTAPTGTVSFTSNGPGVFSAAQCTLTGDMPPTSCGVDYFTPAGVPFKGQTITANYNGDNTHLASTGSTTLP